MRKVLFLVLAFFCVSPSSATADDISSLADNLENRLLFNLSNSISEMLGQAATTVLPGEGITEIDIQMEEKGEPHYSILGVRDISKSEDSNLFTQFSLHNSDVTGDERLIFNFGIGKRFLNADNSMMFGANSFLDFGIGEAHKRGSVGFEARASILEFTFNHYHPLSNTIVIDGTKEKTLETTEWNLSTQVPYAPWARLYWQGYKHQADMATVNTEGDIYSLEIAINPTLKFEVDHENTNHADGDVWGANIRFVYPPQESGPSMLDGLSSDMFAKEDMANKLSSKVRRNNNIVLEKQGAVIITSK